MRNYGTKECIELRSPGGCVRLEFDSIDTGRYGRPVYAISIFSPRRGVWQYRGRRVFPPRTSYSRMYSALLTDWGYDGEFLEDEDLDHGEPWHYL